jgi:hypothetical protein
MRDRSWRRHIEQHKVKSRLKRFNQNSNWWYSGYRDVNNINRKNPKISDYIGGGIYNMYKTHTIKSCDTKYKCKYSPNKGRVRWRENNKKGTREKHRLEFFKILKEYGIR